MLCLFLFSDKTYDFGKRMIGVIVKGKDFNKTVIRTNNKRILKLAFPVE